MTKSSDRLKIIKDDESTISVELSPTRIIEESEEVYPSCMLPEQFFQFALAQQEEGKKTSLLSIGSWDGREILSVVKKQ